MQANRQLVSYFFKKILEKELKQDTLLLNFALPKILDISFATLTEFKNESEFTKFKERRFDIVIGDLPFGMQPRVLDTVSKIKGNQNWSFILSTLRMLKDDGQAFFLVEPSILFSRQGKQFLNDLLEEGFFFNSIFELPEKLLYPETLFQPISIHFEKKKQEKLFIAEITNRFDYLLNSFYARETTNNLTTGILVDRKSFESFNKFRIEKEIENLKTQYKSYKKYELKEIASEINMTRDKFQDKPNSIYIPNIGNSSVTSDIGLTTVKHQNLFQVVLKSDLVKAEFLAMFFRSDLGKKQLLMSTKGNFIPKINKTEISNCIVSIPSIKEQDLLIRTDIKLSELQCTIDELKEELSLNPQNANSILDKFESIQQPLKKLSEEDRILGLIRRGENKKVEFKETFSKNIHTGKNDIEIKKSSLKTLVGFLNADGGTLLIGIADNGEIKGVEDDFFKSSDDYIKNFKNHIKDKIGQEFYPLINYDLYLVNGKSVLKVNCEAANEPCFYEQKEFYVRTNPATDKLEGKVQHDYIKERFKDKKK